MKIETIEINRLKEDPRNSRKHSPRNIEAIKSSLRDHGQRFNIVAMPDGTVIAGNGTLRAAKELGWKEMVVAWWEGGEKEARAFAIAANRTGEFADWDFGILASELDDLTLPVELFTPAEVEAIIDGQERTGTPLKGVDEEAGKADPDEGMVQCPNCGHKFPA